MSLGGEGVEFPDDYATSMILRKRIIFTPGKLLKDMMKTMSFKSAGVKAPTVPVVEG